MGMFVSANGGSTTRAPIQWPLCPNRVAYRFPYTLAISTEQSLVIVHRCKKYRNIIARQSHLVAACSISKTSKCCSSWYCTRLGVHVYTVANFACRMR